MGLGYVFQPLSTISFLLLVKDKAAAAKLDENPTCAKQASSLVEPLS